MIQSSEEIVRFRRGGRSSAFSPPQLGAHTSFAQIDGSGSSPAVASINTAASGIVTLMFRGGQHADHANPVDNKGNTPVQLGTDQGYGGLWSGYGWEAWYDLTSVGGTTHTISTTKTTPTLEFSKAWFEIVGGSSIVVAQGYTAAAGAGVPSSTPSIVTTSDAIVFALCSGDGDASIADQTMTPGPGWSLIESSFLGSTAYVPFAIAYKYVPAGTHSLTWTPAANQGFLSILAAVQS